MALGHAFEAPRAGETMALVMALKQLKLHLLDVAFGTLDRKLECPARCSAVSVSVKSCG
jgi:hypothetical protein